MDVLFTSAGAGFHPAACQEIARTTPDDRTRDRQADTRHDQQEVHQRDHLPVARGGPARPLIYATEGLRRPGQPEPDHRVRSIGRADETTLRVEYNGNDDALRRGTLYDTVSGHDIVAAATMMRAPLVHRRRGHQRGFLQKLGADGWIDPSAADIARAAPESQAAVLLRLSRDLETLVMIPSADGVRHAKLFWKDGVIRADDCSGRGLSRLWQVEGQRGILARGEATDRQLSLCHLLDPAS